MSKHYKLTLATLALLLPAFASIIVANAQTAPNFVRRARSQFLRTTQGRIPRRPDHVGVDQCVCCQSKLDQQRRTG